MSFCKFGRTFLFLAGRNSLTHDRITFSDAMNTANSSVWLPRVISEVAREALEPNLILTNLLDRVAFQPGIQIIFVESIKPSHCNEA